MNDEVERSLHMSLETFAQVTQVHPEHIDRLVTLGLLDPVYDVTGVMWFDQRHRSRLAQIQRLRASFSVNYAAMGLVVELLDRIAVLEAQQRDAPRSRGVPRA